MKNTLTNATYQIEELHKQFDFHFMKIDHGSRRMRVKTVNNISLCSYMYRKDLYRWLYNMDSVQIIVYMTKNI